MLLVSSGSVVTPMRWGCNRRGRLHAFWISELDPRNAVRVPIEIGEGMVERERANRPGLPKIILDPDTRFRQGLALYNLGVYSV
jgi:hypothetical protein